MKDSEKYNTIKSNVDYLKENISVDDIYLFADQSISAAAHLMIELCDKTRLKEKMVTCDLTYKALMHIQRFAIARSSQQKYSFNQKLDALKPEDP